MLAELLMEATPAVKTPVCTQGVPSSCSCCGPAAQVADPMMEISVGFGQAIVTRDGKIVYDEMTHIPWTVEEAEAVASRNPGHDWRIIMDSPSRCIAYQRHPGGTWVLIKDEDGFA